MQKTTPNKQNVIDILKDIKNLVKTLFSTILIIIKQPTTVLDLLLLLIWCLITIISITILSINILIK